MEWVVDRMEESHAVLVAEDGTVFSVPLAALGGVREGDVLSVTVDPTGRKRVVAENSALLEELFRA